MPPGVFATQYFYAQNEERGLQVYMHKKDFPPLEPGTRIRASGILGAAYGEDRLKLSVKDDIVVLGAGEIAPEEFMLEELDDSKIGRLVLISGDVIDKSKNGFTLAEEDLELQIVWKPGAGEMPDIFPGDMVNVSGVIQKSNNRFKILPRSANDIEIIKESEMPSAASLPAAGSSPGINPLVYLFAPLLAIGLGFGVKRLCKKSATAAD